MSTARQPPPAAKPAIRWKWALAFVFFLALTIVTGLTNLLEGSIWGACMATAFFGFWTCVAFVATWADGETPAFGRGVEATLADLGIPLDFSTTDPQTALTGGLAKAGIVQACHALQAGQVEDAIRSLTSVIDLLDGSDKPHDQGPLTVACYLRGAAHERCRRLDQALADYTRALSLAPAHRPSRAGCERLQGRTTSSGQPQDGAPSPSEAELAELGFPPHYGLPAPDGQPMVVAWYRSTIAFAYRTLKKGQCDFAVKDANKLIEDTRLQNSLEYVLVLAAAYYVRGLAHEHKGDSGQATLDYRAALQRQPDYQPAARALDRVKCGQR